MTFLLWGCEAHCLPRAPCGLRCCRPGGRGAQGAGEQEPGRRGAADVACGTSPASNTFRLISQGEPMQACGPLPSAWALLRSHHPTEWDGIVCVPPMRTPRLLEGQGPARQLGSGRTALARALFIPQSPSLRQEGSSPFLFLHSI